MSTGRFSDKVAIVTGAARGMGKATALTLARDGATVVARYFVSADPNIADSSSGTILPTIMVLPQEYAGPTGRRPRAKLRIR